MGDSPGQKTDGFHFLGLAKLKFKFMLLCDIFDDINGIQIFDSAPPVEPQAQFWVPGGAQYDRMVLIDTLLYFSRKDQLHIWNIADPMQPVPLGICQVEGYTKQITIKITHLYRVVKYISH